MTIGPQSDPVATDALLRRLARDRARARAVLLFERAWPAAWPALGIIGAFICLALLDVLPLAGAVGHVLALALFAAALIAAAAVAARRVRAPLEAEADRRLEQASGLRHRPLAVLTDTPALPGADGLWRAHVVRAVAQLTGLRVGWPHPGLPALDPRALRCALVVGLVACLAIAGDEAPLRLGRAVTPGFAPPPPAPSSQLQAWITPPGYTGLAPVFLRPETRAVSVPAGSHLTVNLTGGRGEPSMVLGRHAAAFKALDATSYQADEDLSAGGRLEVRRGGGVLGAWEVTVVADAPPVVSFPTPPGRARGTGRVAQTRLPWQASHAYGVASLQAELRLADRPDAPPLVVPIPLPGGSPKEAKGVRVQDLTAHPWAGLRVIARLVAKDVPGLAGVSEDAPFELPERRFENPVARALMAVRKELSRRPEERAAAILDLDTLAAQQDAWGTDYGAYLNLRALTAQLRYDREAKGVESAQARMWLLALHLEEAAPERTARDLEQARQAAREMMDQQKRGEPVDKAELERKLKAVEEALQRHLQALAEQARRDPSSQQFDPDAHPLDARDMQRLADEARKAAQEGKMDEARDKMAELDKLLEELQNAQPQNGRMTERERQRAEKRQRGQQQMNALQDMVQREGGLLDHSQGRDPGRDARGAQSDQRGVQSEQRLLDAMRRSLQQPRGQDTAPRSPSSPSQPPKPDQQQTEARQGEQRVQGALRRALGELMQQYGDLTGQVPPNLGEADTAMRDAGQALSQGRDAAASGAQQKAIEALQKGGRSMSMQMAQQFGRSKGQGNDEGDGDGDQDGDQDGQGDQAGSGQDGAQYGGQQYGRDSGRVGRPWEPHGRADRRADDRRDPLGRPLKEGAAGADESGDVEVPEKMEEARTRAIQEELRRRDSDRSRPQPELDYIERLLKQF